MAMEPTHDRIPASSALTERQLDGPACAACGEPVDWLAGPHEFVRADGSSAVVCKDCCDIIAENTATDDDATAGKSTAWPDGEPTSVRAAADNEQAARVSLPARILAHAGDNADLSRRFTDQGETDLATAFADISSAFRMVAAALQNGEDVGPALDRVDAACERARAALAAARARLSSTQGGRA